MSQYSELDLIAAPVFVLEPGPGGEPVYAAFNAEARKATGRPLSDYLGRTAQQVYPAAYGQTALERHREVMALGQPMTYELELPLGGEPNSIRTTLTPDLDEAGKVRSLYGTSQNITAERRVMEARVSFDTIASEMEQFVALLADMLREDFDDLGDGKLELIKMLEDVACKSMGLISEVLAHAQTTKAAEAATEFNFAALCQDIVDVLDPRSSHEVVVEGAEIVADRTAMQIALRNITENAFKHGKRDRIRLRITIEAGEDEMLLVKLRDNGGGFTEAALKFMNGGGFGIEAGYGLHGVKRLLTARGGQLQAGNLPDGSGSCVAFTLPGRYIRATRSLVDRPSLGPLTGPQGLESWPLNT